MIPAVIVDLAPPPTGKLSLFNLYVALLRSLDWDTICLLQDFDEKALSSAHCYAWSWVRGKRSLWVKGSRYEEGLHLVGSRGSYTRDFLGIGQGVQKTSHQFGALVKALKESEMRERKRGLDWYI